MNLNNCTDMYLVCTILLHIKTQIGRIKDTKDKRTIGFQNIEQCMKVKGVIGRDGTDYSRETRCAAVQARVTVQREA